MGLYYCYINNIFYCDIKGSNLFINNNGVLKLVDFGLVKLITNENVNSLMNRVIIFWYCLFELLFGVI